MAWTNPTTQSTGTLITATIWNTDIVDNLTALRSGSVALTSQATGDVIYASSSTQLGRVAIGSSGYVLTSNGSAPAWSNTPTLTGTNFTGIPAASILAGTFGSGNYTIPGLLTVSGFGTHSFSAGGTGANSLNVRNTTSGTGNYGEVNVGSNTDAQVAVLRGYSSAFTTSGSAVANGAELRAPFAGGLSLSATNASGDVRIYSRNALAATFSAAQMLSLTGDVNLAATKKLYLDGGGNSYLHEVSADNLQLVSGGLTALGMGNMSNSTSYTGIAFGNSGTLHTTTGTVIFGRTSGGDMGSLYFNVPTGQWYSMAINGTARFVIASTGATTMSYYGAGTATFDASGNITSVSDERQKDIEGPFTLGLNALMGVRPILYRYKASTGLDTENVYAGFSAQNVRDYIPEAIGKNLDGIYSLNIVPVLAATVTAVQELSRELDELRAAANLPAKTRTVAPVMDDARVINSDTPKRRSELAKDNAERAAQIAAAAEAEKMRVAESDGQKLKGGANGGTVA